MHHRPQLPRPLVPLLGLALFALVAAACGEAQPQYSPQVVDAGGKAFQSTCATCHGRDANGLPKLGKSLLMNPFVQEKTDDELVAFVKSGRPASDPLNSTGIDMPPKGGNPALKDEDLKALVAYLRSLQKLS